MKGLKKVELSNADFEKIKNKIQEKIMYEIRWGLFDYLDGNWNRKIEKIWVKYNGQKHIIAEDVTLKHFKEVFSYSNEVDDLIMYMVKEIYQNQHPTGATIVKYQNEDQSQLLKDLVFAEKFKLKGNMKEGMKKGYELVEILKEHGFEVEVKSSAEKPYYYLNIINGKLSQLLHTS